MTKHPLDLTMRLTLISTGAEPLKRKACRKRAKVELRDARRSALLRDQIRASWIAARCRTCGRCPKHIAKLPSPAMDGD